MKHLLLALILLVSPVAAQTIGGPHRPANQIGGPTPPKNLAVAQPRGAPTPSVTPISRPLVQKVVLPSPSVSPSPSAQRGMVVRPSNALAKP
jgi:hypothetical protein